jgi:hypothetical protein
VIVASLLLILVAVTLLVFGLATGSSLLLISSIAASLIAAVALVVGARQAAAARAATGDSDDEWSWRAGDEGDARARHRRSPTRAKEHRRRRAAGWARGDSPVTVAEPPRATVPGQGTYRPDNDHDEGDSPDEPAVQHVPAADAARVARMSAPVLVIDGRPRYHVPGCVHLSARGSESLSVSEAVELGFTPCSLCEPASALLADARRV